jgi:hypothetical protein
LFADAAIEARHVSPPPATDTSLPALVALPHIGDLDGGLLERMQFERAERAVPDQGAASSIAPLMRSIDCAPTSSIMPSAGIASTP